jgi:hypothetical protein
MMAASGGYTPVVMLLLEEGADPNLCDKVRYYHAISVLEKNY